MGIGIFSAAALVGFGYLGLVAVHDAHVVIIVVREVDRDRDPLPALFADARALGLELLVDQSIQEHDVLQPAALIVFEQIAQHIAAGCDIGVGDRDFEDIDISESPYFSSVFEDLEFGAHGGLLRFASFEVAATIASDAETLGGVRYHAVLGVNEIAELLSAYGDIESLCDTAEILGIPCEICPDDDHSYCVTVAAEHIEAHRVDVDLEKVEEPGTAPGCDER